MSRKLLWKAELPQMFHSYGFGDCVHFYNSIVLSLVYSLAQMLLYWMKQ